MTREEIERTHAGHEMPEPGESDRIAVGGHLLRDLRLGVGLADVVVDLDADRGVVEVGDRAPRAAAGMPGAVAIGDQLVDAAVVADQVMRTDRALAVGAAQGVQALPRGLLLGRVQDDDQRAPRLEVRRRHPFGQRIAWRRVRAGGEQDQQQDNDDGTHAPILAQRDDSAATIGFRRNY